MSTQPQGAEPVPVQLTRIEGTVNLIAYQMSEVKQDISEIRADITGLHSRVGAVELAQAKSSGAFTSWKSWLPIIIAAAALLAVFVPLGG
jgi:hypothetical protein